MKAKRRSTRAAIKDIYPGCRTGGYCPPDVRNKVEGTTPADYILKILSGLVFFGGLGISSIGGSGGRFGYRPFSGGGSVRPNSGVRPPTGAVETFGADVFSGGTVDASSPSVIELTDLAPDETIINTGTDGSGPTVTSTSEDPLTVEVTAETQGRPEVTTSTTHPNPTFDSTTVLTTNPVVSGPEVEITGSFTEAIVGPDSTSRLPFQEAIELATFSSTADEFETAVLETTEFSTSTPRDTAGGSTRPKFYSKRYTQVHVDNPLFLDAPQQLVQPGYDAEDVDTSVTFDLGPPPLDDAFQDVIQLSRPYTTQRPTGHLRVSRLGQVASIGTRSGKIIGPHKHFYYDLSSIDSGETIELNVLDSSGTGILVEDPNVALAEISLSDSLQSAYSDEDLLDVYESISEHAHLILGGGRRRFTQTVPVNQLSFYRPVVSVSIDYSHSGVNTSSLPPNQQPIYPVPTNDNDSTNATPILPSGRTEEDGYGFGYYPFDPSLFGKKKRKRKKRTFI